MEEPCLKPCLNCCCGDLPKNVQRILDKENAEGTHLEKMLTDTPFHYQIGLRSGLVLNVTDCEVNGDWLRVYPLEDEGFEFTVPKPRYNVFSGKTPRGMDIRVSEIVWIIDGDS